MDATATMQAPIFAVIVLYKREPRQSESFTSLIACLASRPALAGSLHLLVYDNSPEPQTLPPISCAASYLSDPANSGLAGAYNTALQRASDAGTAWLLLLDQDTLITAAYLDELCEAASTLRDRDGICAIVPRLVDSAELARVHSPTHLPRLSHRRLDPYFHGLAQAQLSAFNSGALLRVAELQTIGGFPTATGMEFLDHIVFSRLQASGDRLWVLRAALPHSLAIDRPGRDITLDRYRRILLAERNFYLGSLVPHAPMDRIWYRLRRLRHAAGNALRTSDKRFALLDLCAAFGILGK